MKIIKQEIWKRKSKIEYQGGIQWKTFGSTITDGGFSNGIGIWENVDGEDPVVVDVATGNWTMADKSVVPILPFILFDTLETVVGHTVARDIDWSVPFRVPKAVNYNKLWCFEMRLQHM